MSVGQSGADLPTPMGASSSAGVTYTSVDDAYFEARKLKRYARVSLLWALGAGAVISGHYSGLNLGLANGFGSMVCALMVIATMYLGLTFTLAAVTLAFQLTDPVFRNGVFGVAIYYAVMMAYFLAVGRHKLILSPEEEFALSKGQATYKAL